MVPGLNDLARRMGWLTLSLGLLLSGCSIRSDDTIWQSRGEPADSPDPGESSVDHGSGMDRGLAGIGVGRRTPHLIMISIDGLRPDAIRHFSARTLERLISEGAYTLEAETIFPSKTLPSHISMLTGLPPAGHGVTWNSDETDRHGLVDVVTVFEAATAKGLGTAAFFSKSKFHHLLKPGTLDHAEAPRGMVYLMSTETVESATRYLKHRRPDLIFIHIAEPDYAGHLIGWMSRVYGWAVRRADSAIARILAEADRHLGHGNYTVLITSDHGGHGRSHGSADPRDMTIPWIVWGHGVRAGELTPWSVRTMDTAATALWLLGVDRPTEWVGRPVTAAFH